MQKSISWVDSICKDIGAVLSKFQLGKNFEASLDMAHNLGVDLRAPTWFSETRFASYAHNVFKNFSDNYGIVRRVLDNIAASDNRRAKDADDLLRRIRTLEFVVKLLLCVDFYHALGVISQTLQQVNIPFWKRTKAIEYFMVCLSEMVEGKPDHVLEFHTHKADLQEWVFVGLPLVSKDVALMTPSRETNSLPHSTALADSTNLELPKVVVGNALTKGKVKFQAMISSMNTFKHEGLLMNTSAKLKKEKKQHHFFRCLTLPKLPLRKMSFRLSRFACFYRSIQIMLKALEICRSTFSAMMTLISEKVLF